MNKSKIVSAVCAGLVGISATAVAKNRPFPTPPPSAYVDAESSVNVSLPTNEGRRVRLTLAFASSPTNAVQVAFGRDADGDGNLAPEETEARVGVDCGVPLWNGHLARSAGEFDLKQPINPAKRWNLAKVTTHNIADTNVTVSAKFYSTGFALILR